MLEVVIGDVHARGEALGALLRAVGVLDARGRRCGRAWVVQVGDLLDRRASHGENLAVAELASEAVDVVLAALVRAGGGDAWRPVVAGAPARSAA